RSGAIALDAARRAEDGLHLRVRASSLDAQVLGLDPERGGDPLAAVVPLDADGLDRLRGLERRCRALHGPALPMDSTVSLLKRRDLRLMMRTVDGRGEGPSLREIAEVFFGAERVASDPWKTSSLRDKMNRLFREGQQMIATGYRKFLRPRRRP